MRDTLNLPQNGKKRVIIIGAGFAGIQMAQLLKKSKFQVVLIDKRNFHQFQPLLYQVATSGIEPSSISFPIRRLFQSATNIHFRNAELIEIKQDENIISTSAGEVSYDYLILAQGVDSNYFGNKNIENNSLPMKSTAEALFLRNRILSAFERAILTDNKEEQTRLLSTVIVGGGPTGVELAGALAEMKKHILPKDYPELDNSLMKIRLYEGSPRLLNGMSEKSGTDAVAFLEKLGVEVHTNSIIEDYDGVELKLKGQDDKIVCNNFIWAAGVQGKQIPGINNDQYGKGSRLRVNRDNKLIHTENIYAVGDACIMSTDLYPNGHPQVAQVAMQQAQLLAKNLKKSQSEMFEYNDRGSMATVGRHLAVCDLPKLRLSGTIAWILWLFIHLVSIIGIKNKILVFANWAQNYFYRDQSLRILILPFTKKIKG